MFKKNDTVLYSSEGVCVVNDITQRQFKDRIMQYYVLKPVYKEGATVFVPVENKDLVAKMKRILSVEDIHQLIEDMPNQTIEWIDNDNLRKDKFREILRNGNRKQLIQLIRTIYLKQEELKKIGKKIHATDDNIFKEAEQQVAAKEVLKAAQKNSKLLNQNMKMMKNLWKMRTKKNQLQLLH